MKNGVSASTVALLPVLLLCAPPLALGQSEGQLENLIAKVVRGRYQALHACFRRSLSDNRSRGGTIFVRLTLGRGGRVVGAKIERDELKHLPTAECVLGEVSQWTLAQIGRAGVDEGSEIIVPLTFESNPQQRVVARQDVAARTVAGAEAQVLLGAANVGVTAASLTALRVQKTLAVAPREGVSQVVYVLGGRGQLTGGKRRRHLRRGSTVTPAVGEGARLVCSGRQPLQLLHFSVPRHRQYLLKRITRNSRARTGPRLLYLTGGTARTPDGQRIGAGHAVFLDAEEQLQRDKGFVAIRLWVRPAKRQP